MKKRIFLAINLSEAIKKKIMDYYEKWSELPIRWTSSHNLHITVLFLGYMPDEALPEIIKAVENVANKTKAFNISLNKIIYGPPGQKIPRMVWLEGDTPKELIKLNQDLTDKLMETKAFQYWQPEKRGFKLHLTLGRLKGMEFRQMEYPPEINEDVDFEIPANSVEVMESSLKRSGAEYNILQSFDFL